jgi:pectinesterase
MRYIFFLLSLIQFSNVILAEPVKYDIIVAKDGSGKFKTVQEAINCVADNQSVRTVIYVKNGTYKEKVILPSSKLNVSLIGESAEQTVITFDDYNPKVKGKDTITTWNSFTFSAEAEGFIAENITFENTAGRVGQAVALRITADKVIFRNCRFLGNQDTLFAHGIGRMYFGNCYIEGTTDFIFGSAIALFENCQIHSKHNSYVTAASTPNGNSFGYIFLNCTLTADTGVHKVYLGRPWRAYAKTVFIHCNLGPHICPEGWHNWQSPREKTAYYAEYKNTGPGANVSGRVAWSKQLTDEEAALYTVDQIFARNSVSIPVLGGNWNPYLIK